MKTKTKYKTKHILIATQKPSTFVLIRKLHKNSKALYLGQVCLSITDVQVQQKHPF